MRDFYVDVEKELTRRLQLIGIPFSGLLPREIDAIHGVERELGTDPRWAQQLVDGLVVRRELEQRFA